MFITLLYDKNSNAKMIEGVQMLSIYEKMKLRVVRLHPMLYTCVGKLRLAGKKERQMKSHTMRSVKYQCNE